MFLTLGPHYLYRSRAESQFIGSRVSVPIVAIVIGIGAVDDLALPSNLVTEMIPCAPSGIKYDPVREATHMPFR